MIADILVLFSSLIIKIISAGDYFSVIVLMALESACIPIPSEIIMPFSGYLALIGQFNLWMIAFCATIGNLIGSLVAYFVGFYEGRPLLEKYGKYLFINHRDVKKADQLFEKHGFVAVFFGRLLPIVRTFISLPAGIARMDLRKFILYTFIGSFPWNFGLAYLGFRLGEEWNVLEPYFHKFDILIGLIIGLFIIWWIHRHFK